MKTPLIPLLFFITLSFGQKAPTHYKADLDLGSGTVLSTFLDVTADQDRYTITSPKNADVRMMGGKAKLGRAMGKSPKEGIIIRIIADKRNDSLFGETKVPMLGSLRFKGIIDKGNLSGELINSEGASIGSLKAVPSTQERMSYGHLYPKILQAIEDNIYSKKVLQTKEWKKFQKETQKLFDNAQDDIELFLGFNLLSQNLPFSHLNFYITEDLTADTDTAENPKKAVFFEAKNPSTAYLQIKNFSTSQNELAAILPQITTNTDFKNLIIDLRDNGGGGIEAAFELARHIVSEDLEVGYFVTNKLTYSGYQPELFRVLPEVHPKRTEAFGEELKSSPGVKLLFKKPANPIFTGKIYVLTNSKTGSTCEPIVYALKNTKKATIIGERTHGGMLAAFPFEVEGKYIVMVPIADFYTYDGVRLDQVGVAPDIEVKPEEALQKAMELINNQNK